MVVSLVWFNQGFWFGSVISHSSIWTPWNIFFTSAVVLFALVACLFIAFVMKTKEQDPAVREDLALTSTRHPLSCDSEEGRVPIKDDSVEDETLVTTEVKLPKKTNTLFLARFASFANGASFAW